ncbi:MAG: lysoplasmalogenase family protein [Spirochaetales bacterium]|nr:lysoplasmalogenase family protein [Spirochaetales bacterium]
MLYLLFLIPLFFSVAAVKTNFYPFKVCVTLSCIIFILFDRWDTGLGDSLYIVIAFLFSIAGDYFLSHRWDKGEKLTRWFVAGIALFFMAHVFYLVFLFQSVEFNPVHLLIVIVPMIIYYVLCLYPHLKPVSMKIAIFIYLVISCFSLSMVFGYNGEGWEKIGLIGGISLIVFSDLCIAEVNFMDRKPLEKLILPTYYAAHIVITFGLIAQ